jgi:hypothetical protein
MNPIEVPVHKKIKLPETAAQISELQDDYADAWRALRRSETTGSPDWIAALEARTGRTLTPQERGPKRASKCVDLVNCHRNSSRSLSQSEPFTSMGADPDLVS